MKVLHICQQDDAAGGGAVRVAVELAKRQVARQVDAKCVFAYGGAGVFGEGLAGKALYLQQGPSSHRVSAAWNLYRLLKEEKPDIIHHHDGLIWTHLVTRTASAGKCIGHGHLGTPLPTAHWKHRLAGYVHRRTYDHLFCVSEDAAQSWRRSGYPGNRIEVIPNGVDTEVFAPATEEQRQAARLRFDIPSEATVFSFVGRLHNEMKRCDDFIRTVAAMPGHVWGLIAGTGVDDLSLRQLAVELKVSDRVHFTGLLNPATACYHASDVFLMTSSYEPFGLVVLEAAACGLPVAGFKAEGGVNDLMKFIQAPILEFRDPVDLGNLALSLLLKPASKFAEIREALCENFSWDRSVDKILHTYSEILTGHPSC
ncbi:hypothetical protein GCM10023213_03780 [Prosthecobacter algae]|uniref:Glycosyltransferase involved in cell wall biosynthesis n=1 Tax=Prosthecobacter algae TaxID=1144682 RepID=A0ABP9NWU3_9BACT